MSCMWENKQQLKARSGHILSCYMRSAKGHLLTRGATLIRTRSFLFRPSTSESELDAWKKYDEHGRHFCYPSGNHVVARFVKLALIPASLGMTGTVLE